MDFVHNADVPRPDAPSSPAALWHCKQRALCRAGTGLDHLQKPSLSIRATRPELDPAERVAVSPLACYSSSATWQPMV